MITVFIAIVISSFLELLGVAVIVPFVQAVATPDELANNVFVKYLCNFFGIVNDKEILLLIAIMIVFVYLGKNAFIIYANYIRTDYATSLKKELSIKMLKKYMDRPYSFFLDTNSSEIRCGCNDATAAFYNVIEALLGLATEMLTIILIGIYLIRTDWITALGTICIMGVVLVAIVFFFKPMIKKAGKINKDMVIEKSKSLMQAVDGIKDIFVMKRKDIFIDAYEIASENERKSGRTYTVLNSCPDRITEGLCISGILLIVCWRLTFDYDSMVSYIPKLATFALAAFKILPSVGKIANRINIIVYNRSLQEVVYTNFLEVNSLENSSSQEEIADCNYADIEKNYIDSANEIAKDGFEIRYKDVTWKYNNQKNPVLNHLSLSFKKGESIGFIGPSGAGKTTAADVLLGLLRPQEGEVLVNKYNIFRIPMTWSRMVGYVPQSVYLIDDTIRANIAFGVKDISDDDIWLALKRAQLAEFVNSLPDKLDTFVGERGVKLSGGQRQRIAIARALYCKPQILVMDEATAALDNETENAVMEAIESLQGDITLVIVAHRLTTIRKCDRIYEIRDGIATERLKQEVCGVNNAN